MLPSRMSDGLRCLGDFTNGWPEGFFQETFNYGAQCAEQDAVQNCPVLATSLTVKDGWFRVQAFRAFAFI